MSTHNPDQNPTLDEIESAAATVAGFWMDEGEKATAADTAYDRPSPTRAAGFTIAAALFYQAERQVDAAHRVADALQNVADAINQQTAKGARDE